jgi:Icc-related predicted phosphoesterase
MPSLCIISDTHRKHRAVTIPSCDILIHCGDFCDFQTEDRQTLGDVDAWFAESPAKEVVCVGGNHDFLLQSGDYQFAHARFLEDSLVEVGGLSIYGSPWCPELFGFAYFAKSEEIVERWRRIPTGIDVLITHSPPFGILDHPGIAEGHLGCPHLREELKRIRPRVHAFGHIHEGHGMEKTPTTCFINASIVAGDDLEVRYSPTSIDLDA